MIDKDLLRRAGWSDELIHAAEQAAASVIDPVREVEVGRPVVDVAMGSQRLELDPSLPAGDVQLHIV